MEVCFVVAGYPTKEDPVYAFIRPVVMTLSDMGIRCTVISPQRVLGAIKRRKKCRPEIWYDYSDKGNKVAIFQPRIISFSNVRINGNSISSYFWHKAVKKTLDKYKISPDILYGHFWEAAIGAAIATDGSIPVLAVTGESKIRVTNEYDRKIISRYLPQIRGVISVSEKNLAESESLGLMANRPKTIILPNGYDPETFYPMEKKKARGDLGLPEENVIACFVGAFTERKGVNRVIEAAKTIPGLKLLLIGSGGAPVDSDQILFKGKLAHEEIVKYLNASDFFVLPTLAEGCCNAIVEALACGLPVISSDRDFNLGLLNKNNAILVDPENIDEISSAMRYLTENPPIREEMKEEALRTAEDLKIDYRCEKIVEFISELLKENET